MKKKIRCIYIDGMERSGKTSVLKEVRKYLKNENKDLHEIVGTDMSKLEQQTKILNEDTNTVVLKDGSVLGLFYNDVKESRGVNFIEKIHGKSIMQEKRINNQFGAVHFFLIPTKERSEEMYPGGIPDYIRDLELFYKNVNSFGLMQGLDIVLISYDEDEKVYDVCGKLLNILEGSYAL